MKKTSLILLVAVTSILETTGLAAKESLNTLLPPPSWLRSRAEELKIDAETRQLFEQIYQKKSPSTTKSNSESSSLPSNFTRS